MATPAEDLAALGMTEAESTAGIEALRKRSVGPAPPSSIPPGEFLTLPKKAEIIRSLAPLRDRFMELRDYGGRIHIRSMQPDFGAALRSSLDELVGAGRYELRQMGSPGLYEIDLFRKSVTESGGMAWHPLDYVVSKKIVDALGGTKLMPEAQEAVLREIAVREAKRRRGLK